MVLLIIQLENGLDFMKNQIHNAKVGGSIPSGSTHSSVAQLVDAFDC